MKILIHETGELVTIPNISYSIPNIALLKEMKRWMPGLWIAVIGLDGKPKTVMVGELTCDLYTIARLNMP